MANTTTGESAAAFNITGTSGLGTGSTPGSPEGTTQAAITDPHAMVNLTNLKQWTLDQLQRLRNFRRPYDQRRAYFYRAYIGQRDRKLYPDNLTPRSNTYCPYPKGYTESVVSRVHDAFFSIDPPIEVRSNQGNDYSAEQMQDVLLTCLHRANWIKVIELLTRDLCIYGHGAIMVDWDWDYDWVTGPEPVFQMVPVLDPNTNQPVMNPDGTPASVPLAGPDGQPIQIATKVVSKRIPRNCPKLSNIDIYDLLIDPDGKIKARIVEISYGELTRMVTNNPDLFFPEAIAELNSRLQQYKDLDRDGIIIRVAEVWDSTNQTCTQVTFGEDADAIGWKDRRYQYRNASYSAYKRRVYNGPPVLLYHGPNTYAHKRCPILDTGYVKTVGDLYGIGLIESIADLTEGVNVFTNMITDNWNMGINRRYAYNTQTDIDHEQLSMGNVPGGKIGVVGNPADAIMPLPTLTPNVQDYQIIDLYRGLIEMTSGISDFYAMGQGSPVGNKTSSGISQIINQSGYVFKLLIRNMENDILQPMMEMVAALIQQNGTDEMEYSITNKAPGIPKYGRVPLTNLIGSFSFDFLAANYATAKEIKQRNLMAFYNIALQSPYLNQGAALQEIARCLEIPYANRILKTDTQVQQEQQAAQQSQIQMAITEKLLDFESDALVKAISKKEPNLVTEHATEVQRTIEDFLASQAGVPLEGGQFGPQPVEATRHEGRPSTAQMEGQIPGASQSTNMNQAAQMYGANATGVPGV